MTEDEEREERQHARRTEQRTRKVCGGVAGVCGCLGIVALASMGCAAWRASGVLQPAASFLLATSVVAAARHLGDPIGEFNRRKREDRPTPIQALLRLWLGCFGTIWTAIIVTQALPGLIAAVTTPAPKSFQVKAPSGSVVRVEAGTRTSRIAVQLPEGAATTEAVSVQVVR